MTVCVQQRCSFFVKLFWPTGVNCSNSTHYKHQVLSSSWDEWSFGHNRHGPKNWGLCPHFGGSLVPI